MAKKENTRAEEIPVAAVALSLQWVGLQLETNGFSTSSGGSRSQLTGHRIHFQVQFIQVALQPRKLHAT